VQDAPSHGVEVAKGVVQCADPTVTQRATEERAACEVFKRYPSKLTVSDLRLYVSEYRLPCGIRIITTRNSAFSDGFLVTEISFAILQRNDDGIAMDCKHFFFW